MDEWFENLKYGPPFKAVSTKEVVKELGENHRVIHLVVNPPIVSPRETLAEWKRVDLDDKQSLLLISSTFLDEVPIKDNILRTHMYKC